MAVVNAKGWTPHKVYLAGGDESVYGGSEDENDVDVVEIDGLYYAITSANDINSELGEEVLSPNTNIAVVVKAPTGSKYTGIVNIPPSIEYNTNTYPVVGIGERAFVGCDNLTEVTIPNSVIMIGESAFQCSYQLTKINIPNSVLKISAHALADCWGITRIDIPNSVVSIEDGTFKYCRGLNTISIPNSVKRIGVEAFECCESLTSIDIPSSVTSIDNGAFAGCSGLTSLLIPSSITSIGESAFASCDNLRTITSMITEPFAINNSVFGYNKTLYVPYGTKAKYEATAGWNQLMIEEMEPAELQDGDTFTEAGITYQVISASEKTAQLKRGADVSGVVNIPSEVNGFTVKAIGKAAFRELRNITAVTIPNSVVTMERSVFDDCSNLTSVSIPGSVTSIGVRLFTSCKKLTSVTVASDNPVYDSRNNCNAIIETATNTLIVGSIASVIPESVVTIGPRAFEEIGGMVNVVIPEGVTGIEELAFVDCSALKEVTLPSTLTSISMNAFLECPSITKVTCLITNPFAIDKWTFGIEDSNYAGYFNPVVYNTATLYVPAGTSALYQATDGWKLFSNIVEMQPAELQDGDTFTAKTVEGATLIYSVISASEKTVMVRQGENVRKVTIPETVNGFTVVSIGREAFENCTDLAEVVIPNTVTEIKSDAFGNCAFTSFVLPKAVTSIRGSILWGCRYLTNVSVESGNTVYDSRDNCNGIVETAKNTLVLGYEKTVIPTSVNAIGEDAFHFSTPIAYEIPSHIVTIGDYAFYKCELTSVFIPESVTSIGEGAFDGCQSLTTVISKIQNPFPISQDAFYYTYNSGTLYVPAGTRALYQATDGWKLFSNIVEMEPEDSNVFMAESQNGVPMTFRITDEENKTCQIGDGVHASISSSTTGKLVLPMTANGYAVMSIAANAFAETGIRRVYIPNTIMDIGENAFKNCSSLDEVNSYIEAPFDMPTNVFSGISSRAYLELPYGTKTNYQNAQGWNVINRMYAGRVLLDSIRYSVNGAEPEEEGEPYTAWVKSSPIWYVYEGDVVIPGTFTIGNETFTVKGIDDGAFEASQITTVSIPKTVRSIDDGAFFNCTKLQTVKSYITEPWNFSTRFSNLPSNAILYVPAGCKAAYEAVATWSAFASIEEMEQQHDYAQGDVNMDGSVNGTDLVALSNIILGRKEQTETADVNDDGSVNGTDIVALSNIILGRGNKAPRRASATASLSVNEDFDIKAGEEKELFINLTNPNNEVTRVQLDLHLPEGLTIKKIGNEFDFDMAGRTTWRKHTLDVNEVDGAYRFLLLQQQQYTDRRNKRSDYQDDHSGR